MKNAALEVDVEIELLTRVMTLSAGLNRARTCPNTSIKIIWNAHTSNEGFHIPVSQSLKRLSPRSLALNSFPEEKKATKKTIAIRATAIVNGAGRKELKTRINRSENSFI
ncbi:MAG: hypothetical protein ACJA15_002598 [Flavobacteriales bacterium]|jgi:hypothetical protein